MKRSSSEESKRKEGSSGSLQQNDGAGRRRKSSEDSDDKKLSRTQSVFRASRGQEPKSLSRTSSALVVEGDDYKSKKADDFMPSYIIPGVKYRPRSNSGERPSTSNGPERRRSSSQEPRKSLTPHGKGTRRQTITNVELPKFKESTAERFRTVTFEPADTNMDRLKARISVLTPPRPKQKAGAAPASEADKKLPNVPQPRHEADKLFSFAAPHIPELDADKQSPFAPHTTELDADTDKQSPYAVPQQPTGSDKQPPETAIERIPDAPIYTKPEEYEQQPDASEQSPKNFGKQLSDSQMTGNGEPQGATSVKPEEASPPPIETLFILDTLTTPAENTPTETERNASEETAKHPSKPDSPPTLVLVSPRNQPPQTVRRLPGGRTIIENIRPGTQKPVGTSSDKDTADTKKPLSKKDVPKTYPPTQTVRRTPGGRTIIENIRMAKSEKTYSSTKVEVDTYEPADTNKDDIKVQIKVAHPPKSLLDDKHKQFVKDVIQPPPPKQKLPPPPPPPEIPKSPLPARKPELKTLTIPEDKLEEREDNQPRSRSKALLDYLNSMAQLTEKELERDEIPSPEFADDNIDVVQLLKKFSIPDQQRALDSLLDTDSVHYDFGGLMRQYYSYVLRSYCLINMQDRYRGVSHPANCFTSVDLSKIGTRDEEMDKITKAKLRKLDEKREQLRNVSVDDDHFNYLKNLANDQATLLPLTVVHMLNEQMAPILEDIFRFYGKNLGTEHKSTKEAGFHYMKIRKRCEMYAHICGGSTINEDLSAFYK